MHHPAGLARVYCESYLACPPLRLSNHVCPEHFGPYPKPILSQDSLRIAVDPMIPYKCTR